MDDLGKTVEDFADSDAALTLSGNAVDNAQKIMWQAHKMINESDGTTLGLLNARRKLDKWIQDNAGKAFDADEINGRNAAQKLIRNQINDAVHEAVPSVGVRDKLLDQHKLLTANDYLTDTMRSEGVDVFDRFVKNISKGHVGPVGAVTTASAIGGALGLTVGTGAAGAAGGAALYTALKAANSATRKRVLGSMIAAAEVPRADKLILIDMLQAEKENPTPPEK